MLCLYVAPSCRPNTVDVGNTLAQISWPNPMLLVGDFNAHSQSWGCWEDDARAVTLMDMFDDLDLVVLNDGSITRVATPPRRSSAIDLTLCCYALFVKLGSEHHTESRAVHESDFS
jgi:Endonuclease-reverse transcriptase